MKLNRPLALPVVRDLLRRFDVDQPVFFGLLAKAWGVCAGPITALLIATRFSPELQGFYFTFATILALKTFVELGLGTVIIQFASHEWSKLRLADTGEVEGDGAALSRLASIIKFSTQWYAVASLVVAVGLGIAGYLFFSGPGSSGVEWILPWFALCVVTALTLLLVPIWSLLEGCNQVGPLYAFRFVQGVVGSLSVWAAILLRADLWSAAISGSATLLCALFFLRHRYWRFLKSLLMAKSGGLRVHWWTEMWPMQWRIAVSWVGGYFVFSFFVPVLFKFQGPVVAGQMGMTWGIVGLVGALADAWLSPRVPMLGMLIARSEYTELDRQFWRITRITIGVAVVVALAIGGAVAALNVVPHPLAERLASRLLAPLPTVVLLFAYVIYMTSSPFSVYLRAHKREPLMLFSVMYTGLVGCSTYLLGKYYSATAMALGFLVLNACMVPSVILIWSRCRAKWHV